MTAGEPVHVAFSMSAAGSIRQALREIGRAERVVGCPDDLSFGPIDESQGLTRQDWVGKWLGYDYDEIAAMADLFWADATSSSLMPVAWFCRRAAHEHAGFLEFVWRMADRPFRVVDLTGLEFRPKAGTSAKFAVLTTGELAPEQIIDARLIERQTPLEASVIDEHRATWRDLRAKNAPLRSVSGGKLASAPITLFDELILSCASRDWQKGARIVATALARLDQYASDLLLWARIRALGESGAMEIDGDPFDSRYALVRRSGSS